MKKITFDLNKVQDDGIDIETWKNALRNFETSCSNSESCGQNTFCIDLTKFVSENVDENWFDKNKHYVCYEGSREAIEAIHLIDEEETEYNFDNDVANEISAERFDTLSLQNLVELGYIFTEDAYQDNYMVVEIDKDYKLKPCKFGAYNKDLTCFSHPFFKSIIDNNIDKSDPNTWTFYFVNIMVNYSKTVAFCLDFSNGEDNYYDFSQVPPPPTKPKRLTIAENLINKTPWNPNNGNKWHTLKDMQKIRAF